MLKLILAAIILPFLLEPAAAQVDPAPAADRVLRNGTVTLHLQQTACSVPEALAGIQPRYHDRFKNARVDGPGIGFRACWTDLGTDGSKLEGALFMAADDGSTGMVDLSGYREDPGV